MSRFLGDEETQMLGCGISILAFAIAPTCSCAYVIQLAAVWNQLFTSTYENCMMRISNVCAVRFCDLLPEGGGV